MGASVSLEPDSQSTRDGAGSVTSQQAPDPVDAGSEPRAGSLTRQLAAALGNVAALTALLFYFGWVRSDVQSRRLGIDESILGMATRDYLLRSVRPVIVLLIIIAVSGLVWAAADRSLSQAIERTGPRGSAARWASRLLPVLAVLLPAAVWVLGFVAPATAFVAFPLACAGGLLLVLYRFQIRWSLPGAVPLRAGREGLVRACVVVLVAVGVFTAAANYATVEGVRLADDFAGNLGALPQVVVYSEQPLFIDAPGVRTEQLRGRAGADGLRVRYSGLRLLERTGGRHFLVSDGWTPDYGVVVVLEDAADTRIEFVRDRR